jgi:hypothetical protein
MINRLKELTLFQKLRMILVIIITIAVGVFIINQFIDLYYKTELLIEPCKLCMERNPHIECYPNIFYWVEINKLNITNYTIP